ncbi:hypothetical protein C0991_011793 [Blastosporella zonata]|nr:hypothetical protein C0991_011793 [Blastosporella zonata]
MTIPDYPSSLDSSQYDESQSLSSLSGFGGSFDFSSVPEAPTNEPTNEPTKLNSVLQVYTTQSSCIGIRMNSYAIPGDLTPMMKTQHTAQIREDLKGANINLLAADFFSIFGPHANAVDNFWKERGPCFGVMVDGETVLPNIGTLLNEVLAAEFLNEIVAQFGDYYMTQPLSIFKGAQAYWTADFCDKPLRSGRTSSKPDLSLFPLQNGCRVDPQTAGWPDVLAVGEMTAKKSFVTAHKDTASVRAFQMLYSQGDRTHVTTFTLNATDFHVQVYDREGVITIGPMEYKTHPIEFLTLIITLSYERPGFDHTMTRKVYDMVCVLHLPPNQPY